MSLTFRFIQLNKKLHEVLDTEIKNLCNNFPYIRISQTKNTLLVEYSFDFNEYDDDPRVIDQTIEDLFSFVIKISADHHISVKYQLNRGEYDEIQPLGVIVDGEDIDGDPSEILEQRKLLAKFEKSIFRDMFLGAGRGTEFASILVEYLSEKGVNGIISRLEKHNNREEIEYFDKLRDTSQGNCIKVWSTINIRIYSAFSLDASLYFDDLSEKQESLFLFKTLIGDRTSKAVLKNGYIAKTRIYVPEDSDIVQVSYIVFPDPVKIDLSWSAESYSELVKDVMHNKQSYYEDELEIIDAKIAKLSQEQPNPWRYRHARYKELVRKDLSLVEEMAEEGDLNCQKLCAFIHYKNQFSFWCKDDWRERSEHFMRMAIKQGDGWANREIENLLSDKEVSRPF